MQLSRSTHLRLLEGQLALRRLQLLLQLAERQGAVHGPPPARLLRRRPLQRRLLLPQGRQLAVPLLQRGRQQLVLAGGAPQLSLQVRQPPLHVLHVRPHAAASRVLRPGGLLRGGLPCLRPHSMLHPPHKWPGPGLGHRRACRHCARWRSWLVPLSCCREALPHAIYLLQWRRGVMLEKGSRRQVAC